MCKISVIIPVKNRSKELNRAINSVLKQTHQDIEILVVDDHSDEDINEVIRSFNDDRIFYFKSNKNPSNANVCRNIGIANAKGKYIAMLDSDDEWLSKHLELGLRFIIESNLDGTFGGFIKDNGESKYNVISRPLYSNEKMVNYLLSDGIAVTPSHIYKSECCKDINWDENLLRHQDFDYSVRFSKKYNFKSSPYITTIVHWEKGVNRNEHYDSNMKFISQNKDDITHRNYAVYHGKIYAKILSRNDIDSKIKKHYSKECKRYINTLSLDDFMSFFGIRKSKLFRLYLRFEFSVKNIFH